MHMIDFINHNNGLSENFGGKLRSNGNLSTSFVILYCPNDTWRCSKWH